jgi:hypothetical protein
VPDYAFPPDLLEQSTEARLDYFKSFTIAHPLLSWTLAILWRRLGRKAYAKTNPPGDVLCLHYLPNWFRSS